MFVNFFVLDNFQVEELAKKAWLGMIRYYQCQCLI